MGFSASISKDLYTNVVVENKVALRVVIDSHFPEERFSVSVVFDDRSFEGEVGWADGPPIIVRSDQRRQGDEEAQNGQVSGKGRSF